MRMTPSRTGPEIVVAGAAPALDLQEHPEPDAGPILAWADGEDGPIEAPWSPPALRLAAAPPVAEASSGNTVSLFLALYLLILAFFILLVSISSPEQLRSRAVMDSLTSTFASVLPPNADPVAFAAREGEVVAGQAFLDDLAQVFGTALRVAQVEVVQPGREMRIDLPAHALFQVGTADIRDSRDAFLDRLVATLSAPPPGSRVVLEFVAGTEPTAKGLLPGGESLGLRRAVAFAADAQARGAPPGSISVALRPGAGETIDVWFRLYPDNAEGAALEGNGR